MRSVPAMLTEKPVKFKILATYPVISSAKTSQKKTLRNIRDVTWAKYLEQRGIGTSKGECEAEYFVFATRWSSPTDSTTRLGLL